MSAGHRRSTRASMRLRTPREAAPRRSDCTAHRVVQTFLKRNGKTQEVQSCRGPHRSAGLAPVVGRSGARAIELPAAAPARRTADCRCLPSRAHERDGHAGALEGARQRRPAPRCSRRPFARCARRAWCEGRQSAEQAPAVSSGVARATRHAVERDRSAEARPGDAVVQRLQRASGRAHAAEIGRSVVQLTPPSPAAARPAPAARMPAPAVRTGSPGPGCSPCAAGAWRRPRSRCLRPPWARPGCATGR